MATLVNPTQTPETVARRLAAATVAHQDAQEVATRCAATWRGLVIEALEAGMTQKDVAELAGVARSRLHAIIATEYRRR